MHIEASPTGDLAGIDPDDLHEEYERRRLGDLSDEQLFDLAANIISIPKRDPGGSFVLHAPLELLARRALLPRVAPSRRDAVRKRMVWVASTYARAGDPLEPVLTRDFDSPAGATASLAGATREKDLGAADAAAGWLGRHGSAADVLALAESSVDSLAAAGHASIYFWHLARTATGGRAALALVRPLAREVARLPELRIEWIRDGVDARGGGSATFARALADTPRLGLPGSDFIFPTVHQVDGNGPARTLIPASLPPDRAAAAVAILRVAAHSMLQDDPTYAPYGWSHCLTLPQSVLGITPWLSSATTAGAIAATYVVGFRAAQSNRDIDVAWVPERSSVALDDALCADPATAASATYHASDEDLATLAPRLAANAASHEDAHLAKYTLACLDAAADDPPQRRLYLAAAAYLAAWWSGRR
jgi:hypothetical protein